MTKLTWEDLNMRKIAGRKTKIGYLIMVAGAIMYIGAEWCPVLIDRVSIGTIIMGAVIAWYGATNRFNRATYRLDEHGNPNLDEPRNTKRKWGDETGGAQ